MAGMSVTNTSSPAMPLMVPRYRFWVASVNSNVPQPVPKSFSVTLRSECTSPR